MLKATKNGKSLFNSNSSLEGTQNIAQSARNTMRMDQTNVGLNLNLMNGLGDRNGTDIPLFTNDSLKKDFTKLLRLKGPKFPSQH